MNVVIALKLPDQSKLDTFLANPQHAILTPTQFTADYAPTLAQAQEVAAFMRSAGFINITISPNHLLVSGDANAGVVASAFHTRFVQVLTPHGRHAFANSSDIYIPASLQSSVNAVLGLQTVYEMHSLIVHAHNPSTSGLFSPLTSGSEVGHNPTEFPTIYGANGLASASSVPVGIITAGSMAQVETDLQYFTSVNGLPSVNVTVVGPGSSNTSNTDEWDLDSQTIAAMGGVQSLVLYDAASLADSDLTPDFNTVASDDAVKVINVSLGECETTAYNDGALYADSTIFDEAAAQGQTFSVASGDSGADECANSTLTPSYPASSRWVVAVGGTSLYTSGSTAWAGETVWNSQYGSTGGSPSTEVVQPTWQNGVGPNANTYLRGVADIAFDADPLSGAEIVIDGQPNQLVGGTSLASPIFVGTWARILQLRGLDLGFAAPMIYSAAASNYVTDFHDITSGNNNGESALSGWDYPTGWGSLIIGELADNIPSPQVYTPVDLQAGYISCLHGIDTYSITWAPGPGGPDSVPRDYEFDDEIGTGGWTEAYEGPHTYQQIKAPGLADVGIRVRATNGSIWSGYDTSSFQAANCAIR
ncbi:MAG: S8/S53 family peptidase [Gammaproteobacteria bacterium]|nr:S53 family peptidase [Gammaproteobacteria bacterium]MBU6508789.1 S53 family peptidase [Gammaproteobacteria bacterium]MDE1983239.1 S8/S53 family peptidase [Gammaproteobacteria bacterium]MDE2107964.1 S8/S53 family peptidase [Gammaproteobacteria bacterium]MDE2462054.1 S8/S53 family peptidase [Gammaproteobacteria bacterium]